ncbi:MAG: hypothetical protein ACREEE_11755 [Dongiaceae bacterium]
MSGPPSMRRIGSSAVRPQEYPDFEIAQMAETAEIIEHIRRRIAAAEIELEPFPHFVTTDVLPGGVYDEILRNWPPSELSRTTNWAARKEMSVAAQLNAFPPAIRPIWQQVVEWSQTARDLVHQKLQLHLAEKLVPMFGRRRAAEMKIVTRRGPAAFLATYTGALSLHAHVDHPVLATNSFLYVSEREVEEPELGTVLYHSYGLALPHNELKLPEKLVQRYLRRVKTVPYGRNMLLSYVNTPSAFHGVDPVDIGKRVRRLLMFGTLLDDRTFNAEEAERLTQRR